MIEILGLKIAWETVLILAAFVASEVIGNSNLKSNSVAQLIKSFLDEQVKSKRQARK